MIFRKRKDIFYIMSKIIEKIVEPGKIFVGSTFKLKVKVINYLTYKELKTKTYDYYKNLSYKDLKGEK